MPAAGDRVESTLHSFVQSLSAALEDPHKVERVLSGKETISSAEVGQRPEVFTENNLIYPLLEASNLDFHEQPYGEKGSQVVWPDFELGLEEPKVIGENKSLNKEHEGLSELKDYLDRKSIGADYGILTDGFEWTLIKIELGGDVTEYPEIDYINLRPAIVEIAREEGVIGSSGEAETEIDGVVDEFTESFEHRNFVELVTETAPRIIRDERKRDVDEFFELYIELLFGESDEYDYQTSLMDDIRSPNGTTESEQRLFAITLVNRLLFIKFLESRNVLPEGFLADRVEQYQENQDILAGNLYESQLKPIFYKLFNTPEEDRDPEFRQENGVEWAKSVPYLNGGLFRENVDGEREITVNDRILPTVISDLIEGSRLELSGDGFDPAVLGNVFEKTINYIEQDRDQKDLGAYYTPNDVTDLINTEAIDPKAKEILIDTFVSEVSANADEEDLVRSNMEEMGLPEILREVEEGKGWFGNADAIELAIDRLTDLKVIDPACGSGHFLTSAMDELTRIQVSLLRGLNYGEDPTPKQKYELKRDLALSTIYGVDVDQVATEIAKLRVWLKIIEANSWEPAFGPLPNIDVNISPGNSLVGLPVKGIVESASIWDEEIAELAEKRRSYKYDREGSPEAIEELMAEIRPEFDQAFLDRYNEPIETQVADVETLKSIYRSIDGATLYPTFESVKAKRKDGASFTDNEIQELKSLGYNTHTKSARLNIQDRESELKNKGETDVRDKVYDELCKVLEEGFIFDEFHRRPVQYDLDNILGNPFHWPIEFPEVAEEGSGPEQTIHFDIILGNPPYGNLINESEEMFISSYITSSINEIASQFVERQVQLLGEGGYLGNITTLVLVYQSNHEEFHELLRENIDSSRISCFGLRGRTGVFDNALIRVGIFSGRKNTEGTGEISTSDLVLFTEDNRQQRFENIQLCSTEGLILRDRIGGGGNGGPVLPKVGPPVKRDLLDTLRKRSERILSESFERKNPDTEDYPIVLSAGGGYWINPMMTDLTEKGGNRFIYFSSDIDQKTAFLIYSSSLYYCYWITYGDQRNHTLSQIGSFPWPRDNKIEEYEEEIVDLADTLWDKMQQNFTGNSFHMSPLRPIIDDVDRLMGRLYNLDAEEVEYTMEYHTNIGEQSGREGSPDTSLTYEKMFD